MMLSQKLLIFYLLLQIVRCNKDPLMKNRLKENEKSVKLHVFAEKFKPFLYDMDDNRTYIGINYLLVRTIGEHLNMAISLDMASNENRLENWKPSSTK